MTATQIRHDIVWAIQNELASIPKHLDFRVRRSRKEAAIWRVSVDVSSARTNTLDESLEGAAAWWAEPEKGGADVLSVDPEREEINLRYATCAPPEEGGTLRIYPPVFLEALLTLWGDDEPSLAAGGWAEQFPDDNNFDSHLVADAARFDHLRERQRSAFNLPAWKGGYLWGPPGTGKTTTLGAVIASCLGSANPKRVLMLSTTNVAVDQALVSVDRSLELQGQHTWSTRKGCKRVGNHYRASFYEGRQHLIPAQDEALLAELASLEAARPEPSDVQAYAAWKSKVEAVRARLRRKHEEIIKASQLVAMTTTAAVFQFSLLRDCAPYDLVVFDESSQVGLAHALMLAPLGRRCIFAGDPRQLSPIVQSSHSISKKWLGRSMFDLSQDNSARWMCFLNEQWRMAKPICNVVSRLFYGGELIVAKAAEQDARWLRERHLPVTEGLPRDHIVVENVLQEGQFSQRYKGPIRFDSAQKIVELVQKLLRHHPPADILVLTPFRAQRALIRSMLRRSSVRGVSVSTVHKAQGSERHTVIFDPVQGSSDFLMTDDAHRLVNVAISRAKARLVLLVSPGDCANPIFSQVGVINAGREMSVNATHIREVIKRSDLAKHIIGKVFATDQLVFKCTSLDKDGRYLTGVRVPNGDTVRLDVRELRQKYGK